MAYGACHASMGLVGANRWLKAPLGGGGSGRGNGGVRGGGGALGGGVQEGWMGDLHVGRFGGYIPPRPSVGHSHTPLTSPPSNHTITLNLILTFATS